MFDVRVAAPGQLGVVFGLLDDASRWLRTKNTDQWSRPWPDENGRAERVRACVEDGRTLLIWDGGEPVATVSVDDRPDTHLWTPAECAEPALYLRRLAVRRDHAGLGLGAEVLDWMGTRAALRAARWIRVDVWTTNVDLHAYYVRQGFDLVRIEALPGYPSGALFQRAAGRRPTPRLRQVS